MLVKYSFVKLRALRGDYSFSSLCVSVPLCEILPKLEMVYNKKIADLDELKKSILQMAFAGELK